MSSERRARTLGAAGALLCGVTIAACASATLADEASWKGVERVVAFGDVHGAYSQLSGLLRDAGVVDSELHWSAGRTHLVSLGDLLDRGDESRQVMDLLMRLEGEAEAAGGRVHVLLGNHEAMNVLGDLRYVTAGEFAAYGAEEPAEARDAARTAWTARTGSPAAEFEKRFPPGYFGHRALFAPEGRYGKWLLARPVAIVIDDTLFMHGGPSAALSGSTITDVDLRYRTALTDYLGALAPLEKAGLVQIEDKFDGRVEAARQRVAALPAGDPERPRLGDAVNRLGDADESPLLGMDGPNWYRGAALCNEAAETDVLRPLMAQFAVKRVVIGHTPAHDGRAASRFDGAVIKLDTGMNTPVYGGHPAVLVLERGEARVLYAGEGGTPAAVPAEPLYVASEDMADADVADLLARGTVTVVGPRAPDLLDVTVEQDGKRTAAVFVAASGAATQRELAAYRVDRLLRLGLVPATVEREVQGKKGYLQARPAKWVTQTDVEKQQLRGGGWCALDPQFQLLYAFDALIGNEKRTADRIVFDAEAWNLLVTGHDGAFGKGTKLPQYLQARPPAPGEEMRRRLAALDEAGLTSALPELDKKEIAAMLARRDGLLASAKAAAAN
jgi:hypothetical protein